MFDEDTFFEKFFKFFIGAWVVGALVSLAIAGVVIWAVVELVLHFT